MNPQNQSKIAYPFLRIIAVSLAALLAGVIMRKLVLSGLEGRIVWVTFYPAVVVASVFGGWTCGILTAVGSCLIAVYGWPLFVPKPFIKDAGDWLGLAAFLFNCVLISGVAALMHRAQRRAEVAKAQAEKAQNQAEAANRAKSMFLANMSHEIRTPMNAVLGFSQLLERDPSLSPVARTKVGIILKSGKHLLGIINDVLEMSRIESGKVELQIGPIDLRDLLEDMGVLFRQRATEKQLLFNLEVDPGLPRFVEADLGKLRQILINLLGNATKFTPKGAISLTALPAGQDRIAIEVRDTGIGISTEEQTKLFKPFERTRTGEQTAGGTGLGLAISREYAHLMDGEIRIHSQPGEGSCFRFECRAPTTATASPSDLPAPNAKLVAGTQSRILVVDDQTQNRQLLRETLEPIGFVVEEACDGEDALAKVEAQLPQIILMDMFMPKLNGIEATRILREKFGRDQLAILGISASAFFEEKQEFIDAGLNGFLAKPFRERDLITLLAQHAAITYDRTALTRPTLDKMPEAWRTAFRQALAQGRISQLTALGTEAMEVDPGLSQWIRDKAASYDIGELKRLDQLPNEPEHG